MTDPNTALEKPELAILSALAHAGDSDPHIAAQVGLAAILACRDMDTPVALLYHDIIRNALTGAARTLLEALMETTELREYKSDFARKYVAEGRAEDILRILEKRGVALSDAERALILTCTDLPTLGRWFDISLEAKEASELFQ